MFDLTFKGSCACARTHTRTHRYVSANAKLGTCFPLTLQQKFGLDCIWFGRLLKVLVVTSPPGLAGPAHSCRCPSLLPRVPNSKPCCRPVPSRPHPRHLCRGRAAGTKAQRAQTRAARGLVARVPLVPESCSVAPVGIPSWRWPPGMLQCC